MKKRLDQHVVDLGLAPSKTKAQELVESEVVEVFDGQTWRIFSKPSHSVDEHSLLRIQPTEILRYVSRGGRKLAAALLHVQLNVTGFRVLDVGISTGGFTDALLQAGAARVTGVDVARDELDQRLKDDPRVEFFSGVNARDLKRCAQILGRTFDAVVIDVSFISLEKILSQIYDFLRPEAHVLALIKPQFEVGKEFLDKKGIVNSEDKVHEALRRIEKCATENTLNVKEIFASDVKGRDGNQEYFLYAIKD
jgi:23S rRNA (cytidine1920-2'-O)/16S rRNA (cytidine1409-2'-O)-methyltransferase